MAHTWIQYYLHGFEDYKVKLRYLPKGDRYVLDIGEGFLTIYGDLKDFVNLADGITAELNQLKQRDLDGNDTI